MRTFPRWGAPVVVGAGVVTLVFVACAPDFDITRKTTPNGTLGQEVFRVLCERVHAGETPTDLTFTRGRAACTQGAEPECR